MYTAYTPYLFLRSLPLWAVVLVVALMAGCTDSLPEEPSSPATDADAIGFSFRVDEVEDELLALSHTRATRGAGTTLSLDCPPQNRPFRGEGAQGLLLNRVEMPIQGVAPTAIPRGEVALPTRATEADIITTAKKNFPDSVTVFGFAATTETDASGNHPSQRPLFSLGGTLIKRIRDWRTSVHWPYDMDVMRFYSVAPAFENTDISVQADLDFDATPALTFSVPDETARQHDLLFGQSGDIDVHSYDGTAYTDDAQQREDGLGKDDKFVRLHYRHILTAVRFARGTLPAGFRITHIRLENIANEGTYAQEAGVWKWVLTEEAGEIIKNGHYDLPVDYTSSAYTPMMTIPSTSTAGTCSSSCPTPVLSRLC